MQKKKSIVAIAGPTASGKSEIAVRLAKRFNGEIISADSRQVYKGLAVGSGRVDGRWVTKFKVQSSKIFVYKNIPHHCIDYVSPKKRFTVVDFQTCAESAIADIHARGKIPFLVGGTGFYIDAVLNNTSFPSAPANPALRKKLERLSAKNLFAMLKKKDGRRAATIDPHNKRRLIRALEIAAAPVPNQVLCCAAPQKFVDHTNHVAKNLVWDMTIDSLIIGVKKEKEELQKAIAKRIHAMLKRGLVAETKKLRTQGLSWRRIAEFGFEYRLPALFLRKKISRQELEKQLIKENWRYAKRQMTWWRHNENICWISALQEARI